MKLVITLNKNSHCLRKTVCAFPAQGTPDDWVERHPEMIRLTGRHPFNSEPPLDKLYDAGFHTPTQLHIVRNHGAVPKLEWETHEVSISGLVAKPTTLSMNELAAGKKFPVSTFPVLLPCAGRSFCC